MALEQSADLPGLKAEVHRYVAYRQQAHRSSVPGSGQLPTFIDSRPVGKKQDQQGRKNAITCHSAEEHADGGQEVDQKPWKRLADGHQVKLYFQMVRSTGLRNNVLRTGK